MGRVVAVAGQQGCSGSSRLADAPLPPRSPSRCLPSGCQGVLSGMFPGTRQPIPVHTTDEIDEILCELLVMFTSVHSCVRMVPHSGAPVHSACQRGLPPLRKQDGQVHARWV